jgi:NhaA family Na+:H+ antiporter
VGAIIVIAFFYSANVSVPALGLAALCFAAAIGLNRARVYRALPYAVVGVLLWLAVLYSGVHPTLAGVLLAFAVPTRSEPNAGALLAQTQSVLHTVDAPAVGTSLESRYQAAVRALEAVVERLLSPAQRMARNVQPWSAYVALPVFAFANAGVELDVGIREFLHPASLGIFFGLFVGKPLGIAGGAWLAVRSGLAVRPNDIKWPQVIAAGFLCGIGFTMSFFIANAAYSDTHVLALAKLSVLAASVTAAVTGWLSFRALHARLEQRSRAQRTPAPE